MIINCRGTSCVRKDGTHVHAGFDGTPVPSRLALNFPPDMLDVPILSLTNIPWVSGFAFCRKSSLVIRSKWGEYTLSSVSFGVRKQPQILCMSDP